MAIDQKIRDEKLQYDINREAAKKSALLSEKTNNYEYLTGEELLPSDQRRLIEQANFTYSSWRKALKNQTKPIKDINKKQIKSIEDHGKQLVESNELIEKDFNISRDSTPQEELKKKYLINLFRERSSEFHNLKKVINPNNLFYIYKMKEWVQKILVLIKIWQIYLKNQ